MFIMLFRETVSYFVSVNMLMFSDVAESKGFSDVVILLLAWPMAVWILLMLRRV